MTQMMRLDFMQRQRQWEAEQAREAPPLPNETVEEDEDMYELPSASSAMHTSAPPSQQPMPDDELDEVLQREDQEIEALLAHYMPGDENETKHTTSNEARSDHMWSDDDDYDALFSEYTDQGGYEERMIASAHDPQYAPPDAEDEAMDLS